jgi:hypothetical protein
VTPYLSRSTRRLARSVVLMLNAAVAFLATVAAADPVLHEQIPSDPHEDLLLAASVDGELPAALQTLSGLVTAPDPQKPAGAREPSYAPEGSPGTLDATKFVPDRDTSRPEVMPYDDPFTPSTAPFKRLIAFDAVDAAYNLYVQNDRLRPVPTHAEPSIDGSDEQFFANLVVDVAPLRRVRIPSVGPDTRIVHAGLSVGREHVGFRILRDSAENWFIEAERQVRARLVMELTIPRASFGGDFSDAKWSDLPAAPTLPRNAQAAANIVAARIGASRALSPRESVSKLVAYFRAFVDSSDPPDARGDIYLDLALSKKGVCRHRAFAFMVTALGLGISTRVLINEAHAWVEVHDALRWRRIDLGGAGRTLRDPLGGGVAHEVPADPFTWPPGAARGEELASRARARARANTTIARGSEDRSIDSDGGAASALTSSRFGEPSASRAGDVPRMPTPNERDDRPRSVIAMTVVSTDARRGVPLVVRGNVRADGDACGRLSVEIVIRAANAGAQGREALLGAVATDANGNYSGALVVPRGVPLGNYEVVARTQGDTRCGPGVGP